MSKTKKKPKAPEDAKRLRKLEKIAADKSRPKKERKAARAELDALRGVFVPTPATGADTAAPSSPSADVAAPATSPDGSAPDASADGRGTDPVDLGGMPADDEEAGASAWRARQDAEVARQWAHFRATEKAAPVDALAKAVDDSVRRDFAKEPLTIEESTPDRYRLEAPIDADRIVVDESGTICFLPEPLQTVSNDPADWSVPERPVIPHQALVGPIRVDGDGTIVSGNVVQEAVEVETETGREFAVGSPQEPRDILGKPEDPVLTNGNGQPMIHYRDPKTGAEKVKGYTRVTTYIDCLDDKTVLNDWKHRTLLEGGAVELLQTEGTSPSLEAVARSVKRTDEALADIDRRTREEGELLELRRQEVQKEHRDTLKRIAEDLMELGGAHEAANKGTDLHRLVELVNNGQPLPDWATVSDRRDIDAYQRAMAKLDAKVLWTERRVVLDDIQVSGTMDTAFLVKLPGMARRIRVVGDVKTGRVDYAPGKIGMQLLLYAKGDGYDWTRPLEREKLSLSQHHGLLIHLPQGEGRCSIYLVDLDLAAQGLALARAVREWRNTAKRLFDLKSPLQAVEVAAAEAVA